MTVDQKVVSSDSCHVGVCFTTFTSFNFDENRNYSVSIRSTNGIGESSETTSSKLGEFNLILYTIVKQFGFVYSLQ